MKTFLDLEKPSESPLRLSCKQAALLVSLSFERRLSFREFVSMRLHLVWCRTCTFYGRQIKALRAIFIRHEEFLHGTPPAFDEKLTDTAKKRIQDGIDRAL